jgi:cytochrome c biogenesis protein CcmG, thiol:disulfide interchange protein DsbE
VTRLLSVLLAAVVSAAVAGCTDDAGGAADPDPTIQPGPQRAELIARADLDPCPPSSAGPADGGLPDVTLPCLGLGPTVHMAGLRGPLVVNIWGSWCVPCQKETPYFATVYRELKHRVLFLGVDTEDSSDSALDFAAHVRPSMRYPSVVDENKAVLTGVPGFSSVPSTLFVDAAGRSVHRETSAYDSADELRADIERYLGVAG